MTMQRARSGRALGAGTLRPRTSRGRRVWQGDYTDADGKRHRVHLGAVRAVAQARLDALIRDRDAALFAARAGFALPSVNDIVAAVVAALKEAGLVAAVSGSHAAAMQRAPSLDLATVAEQYLADMVARCRARSVTEARGYLASVVRALNVGTVDELSKPLVVAWRHRRIKEGASNKTINNELAPLVAALNFAVTMGQLPVSPLQGLPALSTTDIHRRRRTRPLTEDEIERLLLAASRVDEQLTHSPNRGRKKGRPIGAARRAQRPLLVLLLGTGARVGEAVQVRWSDIDFEDRTVTFRGETTKTQKTRTVPLQAYVLEQIQAVRARETALLGHPPADAAPVFLQPGGAPYGKRASINFLDWLNRCFAEAGIPKRDATGRVVHVHAMRHTFTTRLARANVPRATAKKLTGHSTTAMLEDVYTHVSAEETRSAINNLPSLGPRTGGASSAEEQR